MIADDFPSMCDSVTYVEGQGEFLAPGFNLAKSCFILRVNCQMGTLFLSLTSSLFLYLISNNQIKPNK